MRRLRPFNGPIDRIYGPWSPVNPAALVPRRPWGFTPLTSVRQRSGSESRKGSRRSSFRGGEQRSPKHIRNAFETLVLDRLRAMSRSRKPWEEVEAELAPYGVRDRATLARAETAFRGAVIAALEDHFEQDRGGGGTTAATTSTNGYGGGVDGTLSKHLFEAVRVAFVKSDVKGLHAQLDYHFKSFLFRRGFSPSVGTVQRSFADMRYPWEWFPATRSLHRTIHLHVGPTNSGKTYHALQALEKAESGMYCGPLRLLAHEVYARLEARGKRCALLTGEEQRFPRDVDQYYISSTVEMASLNRVFDVAVVDEIQMIADPDRGGAWTGALLGIQARELHLCGEERVVPLIQSICRTIGDECVVHRYERLTPLRAGDKAVQATFAGLEKGDCVVAFSRVQLHALKQAIEKKTGRRCAIIYGSLPPEIRTQQAALFNDQNSEYDFLVASDAIGMGLNLEIRRIVFDAIQKHDGENFRFLATSELRQIGGRAGRFKTAWSDISKSKNTNNGSTTIGDGVAEEQPVKLASDNTGIVTTVDQRDLKYVRNRLWAEPPPIEQAVVVPPPSFVEQFARTCPPGVPLSFIFLRMQETAQLAADFRLSIGVEVLQLADIIEEFDLSIQDRLVLITAPVHLRYPDMLEVVRAICRCVQDRKGGHLCDIPEIRLEMLGDDMPNPTPAAEKEQDADLLESERESDSANPNPPTTTTSSSSSSSLGNGNEEAAEAASSSSLSPPSRSPPTRRPPMLQKLEMLHHSVILYLWVSYRFPLIFPSQELAFHVQRLVERRIESVLDSLNHTATRLHLRRQHARRAAAEREQRESLQEQQLERGGGGEGDEGGEGADSAWWTNVAHEGPNAQAPAQEAEQPLRWQEDREKGNG